MATYPTVAPGSTLEAIQTKVRLLTRSPSENQLTTDVLNNYINTFVVYDFPEHLRMFNQRQTFTFVTNPYQDSYPTDKVSFAGGITNPLYDFQNKYLSVHNPFYIAGYDSFYTQSREQFYAIYPLTNSIQFTGITGDGVTTSFTGVITNIANPGPPSITQNQQAGLLQNNVLFSSVDLNGQGISLLDMPVVNNTTGQNTLDGNLYIPGQLPIAPPIAVTPTNTINYATGAFTITFATAPGTDQQIFSQTVPQIISLPQAVLYYDNTFFVRPVPNQPYTINFEVYVAPTRLLQTSTEPALNEQWQFIAYGAAKKVLEDRLDMESVQLIMPEYMQQMRMCLRRTIVQYTNERTATIYTEQTQGVGGWGNTGAFGPGGF